MTKDKKQVYGVLEKSICFMNGCCEVGMIWKDPIQDIKRKKWVQEIKKY